MQFSKVRKNQHQTHFEDLVLLGKEGLDELNDKIEGFISTLEDKDVGMNTTTKIAVRNDSIGNYNADNGEEEVLDESLFYSLNRIDD